jgi:hypothetical protein
LAERVERRTVLLSAKAVVDFFVQSRGQVTVAVRNNITVILPDKDIDLGIVNDDYVIVTIEKRGKNGVELEAMKLRRDDPRWLASQARLRGEN